MPAKHGYLKSTWHNEALCPKCGVRHTVREQFKYTGMNTYRKFCDSCKPYKDSPSSEIKYGKYLTAF